MQAPHDAGQTRWKVACNVLGSRIFSNRPKPTFGSWGWYSPPSANTLTPARPCLCVLHEAWDGSVSTGRGVIKTTCIKSLLRTSVLLQLCSRVLAGEGTAGRVPRSWILMLASWLASLVTARQVRNSAQNRGIKCPLPSSDTHARRPFAHSTMRGQELDSVSWSPKEESAGNLHAILYQFFGSRAPGVGNASRPSEGIDTAACKTSGKNQGVVCRVSCRAEFTWCSSAPAVLSV